MGVMKNGVVLQKAKTKATFPHMWLKNTYKWYKFSMLYIYITKTDISFFS